MVRGEHRRKRRFPKDEDTDVMVFFIGCFLFLVACIVIAALFMKFYRAG